MRCTQGGRWSWALVGGRFVLAVIVAAGCHPSIHADKIHPDADKRITFDAGRGNLRGTINQMQIAVGGSTVETQPGPAATHVAGPFQAWSNQQLNFCAVALQGSRTRTQCDWVYVANPKFVFTYIPPSGGNAGYPNASSEQTGANLYRLDKAVVRDRALDAVAEYVNWYNAQTASTADDITIFEAANTADYLVAAVAFYVDAHMTWRDDADNRTVFNNNGWTSYSPGWDFPQPADLTLTISGTLNNAIASDDYHGDCEDFAILRAALLRASGFAPWGVWDAIDDAVSHEYNIVLYEGAFRLMDYGRIDRWLQTHTWDAHRSHYGWNEEHGPRGVVSANHDFLTSFADNYPGGKDDGHAWSYQVYYKDTSP